MIGLSPIPRLRPDAAMIGVVLVSVTSDGSAPASRTRIISASAAALASRNASRLARPRTAAQAGENPGGRCHPSIRIGAEPRLHELQFGLMVVNPAHWIGEPIPDSTPPSHVPAAQCRGVNPASPTFDRR